MLRAQVVRAAPGACLFSGPGEDLDDSEFVRGGCPVRPPPLLVGREGPLDDSALGAGGGGEGALAPTFAPALVRPALTGPGHQCPQDGAPRALHRAQARRRSHTLRHGPHHSGRPRHTTLELPTVPAAGLRGARADHATPPPEWSADDPPEPHGDHNAARPTPASKTTAGPPQPPPPITDHPQPRHTTHPPPRTALRNAP